MLILTPDLKAYAVKNFSVAANADDATFRKAIMDAMLAGTLTPAQLHELTVVKQSENETRLQEMISKSVAAAVAAALPAAPAAPAAPTETKAVTPAPQAPAAPATESLGAKSYALAGRTIGMDEPISIRVKGAIEQYSDNRTTATWDKSSKPHLAKAFGGAPVTKHFENLGYTLDMPTERSNAINGVYLKHLVLKQLRKSGRQIESHWEMNEHERDILQYTVHNCKFVGEVPGHREVDCEKLTSDIWRKAVLDDSTSGGLEAVPIEFDAAVILTPLLNGELFPYVDVRTVGRRRIEATEIGNPTMHWGTAEGTAIPLFNTDSFISAFDNTIYPLVGSIELGLDFLADSPLAIGRIVVERFGQRHLQVLDNVIATGNGTNQPEGLFTASGTGTVNTAGGAGQPPSVGDYEALMFAVAKEYRNEAGLQPESSRAMFIGTDTSYRRARAIRVNSSSDERRINGMDYMSYRLHGYRYAISGALTNAQIGYFCMNRYRMYRRQGLEVAFVAGTDWGLVRENKQGIALRSRWGGKLEKAAAGAKCTDAQA